jgi:tetratricopeptide (TPR) repeat protein
MSDPLDDEETQDEGGWDCLAGVDCGPVEIQWKARYRKSGAAMGRREEAECLLVELMAVPEEERLARLEEPRFQDPLLFEVLVEAGHARLLSDPKGAQDTLGLASRLMALLSERGWPLGREIGSEGLCRALCLAGTARRLLGDLTWAENAFERAADVVSSAQSRGFFCRALAVLRWDQGRSEEATALLHQARRRFSEAGDFKDQTACVALLGLLCLDEGQTREAAELLQAAAELDSGGRPWLGAQVWLGRAFCFAAAGERNKAKAARETAWKLYGEVTPEEALLSLYWLEGRGAALVGDIADAANLFDAVRQKRIEQGCLPEATLTTIDLGLARHAVGRKGGTGALVEELGVAFEGRPGLDFALGTLWRFVEDLEAGRPDEKLWRFMGPALRLGFRLQGVPLRPVPFV